MNTKNESKKEVTNEQLAVMVMEIAASNKMLNQKIDDIAGSIDALAISTAKGFEAVDARFDKVENRLDKVENRLGKVEHRLDKVESRLDRLEYRFDNIESQFTTSEIIHGRRLNVLEDKMAGVYPK